MSGFGKGIVIGLILIGAFFGIAACLNSGSSSDLDICNNEIDRQVFIEAGIDDLKSKGYSNYDAMLATGNYITGKCN